MHASRRILLVAALLAAILMAGTTSAWAYFRASGQGTGIARAGKLRVQVLGPSGHELNSSLLLPGHTADALVKVHNPQSVPLTVVSVTPAGAPVASNGCTPTGVSFASQTGLRQVVPPRGTVLVSLPGSVSMSLASAAACQGASFAIPVIVTVRS